jgi:HTH domain
MTLIAATRRGLTPKQRAANGRLWNHCGRLVAALYAMAQSGQVGITQQDLAVRFGVSTRTIYRDLATLFEAGLPIDAIIVDALAPQRSVRRYRLRNLTEMAAARKLAVSVRGSSLDREA